MMTFLKVIGAIFGILVLGVAGFIGYYYYRLNSIKDTHDLQVQADKLCLEYLQEGKGVGLYIGIIQNGRVYSKGYGTADKETGTVPDSNTVFEIGSISKVFTTEIAQQLVEHGQLSWDDNIIKYLPPEARPATDDTTTLLHLATHTSGYPRLPKSWFAQLEADKCDPYRTLTIQDVYKVVRNAEDKVSPSMKNSDYSNLGMGLLGHILEWKTGKPYEQLLQEYMCAPLGMGSTTTLHKNDMMMATGHDKNGNKTCYWTLPVLQGAGAIKSNGADMLRFLDVNMGDGSALGKTFAATQTQVAETVSGGVGRGWHIDVLSGIMYGIDSITWHNGGTGGFRSYLGFIPGRNTGVVVLSNCSHSDFDKLAVKILCKAGTISLK